MLGYFRLRNTTIFQFIYFPYMKTNNFPLEKLKKIVHEKNIYPDTHQTQQNMEKLDNKLRKI